ncbi:MAG: hypothetical protein KGV46_01460 [Pasteurella sp.]|nr:hypothetical protein [Pasteurella sp.]
MKNIQLRLKDSEKTVETFDVADGELLIIEAQRGINYELFNTLSGMAPQNIITKRIDQDLLIILDESEGGGSPEEIIPDIVIRDYYGEARGEEGSNDATGVLVGLHNNGKYYAYVPESSDPNNAVSVLEDNMAEPQAIGGNEVADGTFMPWWALYGAVALFVLTSDHWDSSDETVSDADTIVYSATLADTDAGTGYDTLKLDDSKEIELNLDNVSSKVKNIEEINMEDTSTVGDKLTIDAQDVLDMTDADNKLFIKGDASDEVELDNSAGKWEKGMSDQDGYTMYTSQNGVTLYIDTDVTNIILSTTIV